MSIGSRFDFSLDMYPGNYRETIHCSAEDVGRSFRAYLYYNGVEWNIPPSVTSVKIRGTKPDKTVFEYNVDDFSDNYVDFTVKEQMAIVAGKVLCEIRLFAGDDTIGSANFMLDVETAVYNPDALSESEVTGLNDMIQAATPEAVADWFETEAPTSTVFTNAVSDAMEDYIDEHGMALTKDANGYVKLGGTANGN